MSAHPPLLIELLVEELPPRALRHLGASFANALRAELTQSQLCDASVQTEVFATPRRLGVRLHSVLSQAPERHVTQKLMPVAVGFTAQGEPSAALLKKLHALGIEASSVPGLKRQTDGKSEVLVLETTTAGAPLAEALQVALQKAIAKLPIPKVMTYQPQQEGPLSGWNSVSFVRPVHGLVALHGAQIVPVSLLGHSAGRVTQGHRFAASLPRIEIAHASSYESQLATEGAVIASFEQRRNTIALQLAQAAQRAGADLHPIEDAQLLDEVTALVEYPHVVICAFDREFLSVPQECLILTMKTNQRYFPLLDVQGRLTHQFLVVSNIAPEDTDAIVQGNARVVRPRLADARFFFEQDRKKSLLSRLPALDEVVYHSRLGSQGERSTRVGDIARCIVEQLCRNTVPYTPQVKAQFEVLHSKVEEAARLAKTDLLTDMVGEFPELRGVMGAYYARHEGLRDGVAIAIEDHYKPRFAADTLPRNHTGAVLALADKLETLVGMFGIGNAPNGDKDPFALRRHTLGIIRILMERNLPLDLDHMLGSAYRAFGQTLADFGSVEAKRVLQQVRAFINERLSGILREQGYSAQEVEAVLALNPQRLGEVPRRLLAVRAFAALPQAQSLAAANKRVQNILKKTAGDVAQADSVVLSRAALQQAEEIAVFDKLEELSAPAGQLLAAGDYAAQLRLASSLREVVDAFFDKVMILTTDPTQRQQRLALLGKLRWHMNQVADISKLAT